MKVPYADSGVWDRRFEQEGDLDWGGLWTDPFIELFRENGCHSILDLGCGTGNDVLRLAEEGFQVTGLDFSEHALNLAEPKRIQDATFIRADMVDGLPFVDKRFDAAMANVALHMFDRGTTDTVIQEVRRILRPEGVFIFHVNSIDDRRLREKRRKPEEELDKNLIREEDGQTVHFFTQTELKLLFAGWSQLQLDHLEIPHRETGEPFKRMWRGVAKN